MKRLILVLLLGFAAVARAELEVIRLHHRTVEQVIPVLRPLLEPGGALSGMNQQLIIRTSAANMTELRRVLATLDTVPRSLTITVRHDGHASRSGAGVSLSGGVSSARGGGARVEVRTSSGSTRTGQSVSQTLQVMEGSVAWIHMGQSVPVASRTVTHTPAGVVVTDTVHHQDRGTGFRIVPRLAGDQVILEITAQQSGSGQQGASRALHGAVDVPQTAVHVQQAATTLTGRLGEWIEVGGLDREAAGTSSGVLSGQQHDSRDQRGIWIRVEERQ